MIKRMKGINWVTRTWNCLHCYVAYFFMCVLILGQHNKRAGEMGGGWVVRWGGKSERWLKTLLGTV